MPKIPVGQIWKNNVSVSTIHSGMTLKNILHLPSFCENDEWDSKSKQSIEYDLQLV